MLIGFSSGKGAPGATLAVANIGVALAAGKHPVLAVDLDPAGGVLSAYLGGDPRRGLWPIAYAGVEPTVRNLGEQVQVLHGLAVLCGLPRACDGAGIDLPKVARVCTVKFDGAVLVDAGRLPEAEPVLAVCDRIVVVAVADPVGILAAEQALVSLGPPADRVSVLVTGSTHAGELREVADLLGVGVIGGIPWVPDEVRRRRQDQRPLGGRAQKAFAKIAQALVPMTEAEAPAAPARREAVAHGQ